MGVERRAGVALVHQLVQLAVNKRNRLFECDKAEVIRWTIFLLALYQTDSGDR